MATWFNASGPQEGLHSMAKNPMLIRVLTSDDIPVCAEMVASAPLWQSYGLTPEIAAKRLQDALANDGLLLVADDGSGKPVGFVWMLRRGAFDLSAYIRWLVVASTQRSKGVGQKLLAAAEAQVQPPVRDVFLLCADFNGDAQRFYEREGYRQMGTIPDYVITGVAEYIYRKRLSPP